MGKKSRNKSREKMLSAKNTTVKADDYFSHGPIEMARFGNFNVIKSNISEQHVKEMQEKLAERFPEVCQEIDRKISKIVNLVNTLPPDELLKRAFWEKARHHLGKQAEVEIDHDAALSQRMIDYVQSIIVSTLPAKEIETDISEERWQELLTLVDGLFSKLNSEFMNCQTAANRKNPEHIEDYDEFYFNAQLHWCNVRSQRYLCHDIPFYSDVLFPHDGILKELYDVDVEEILCGLKKIQDSLTFGISETTKDLHEFDREALASLAEKITALEHIDIDSLPELMTQVIVENGWEARRDDVFGRFSGLDLFDLEKVTGLPKSLLDDLSWAPGQDTEFFAEGDYEGWPIRIWPVFKRPFIKLGERHYCFDIYSLFDNLYRSIQRIIIRKKPQYSVAWADKQKELSERIPVELFQKLLPGGQVYQPVYYSWHVAPGSRKQWCEADALLIYSDHLFVIEVKAGAFTYTSPATHFSAYIESLRNLVFEPAKQGKRFLEYLESGDEVSLFDIAHREIGKISKSDFQHITICAVTLDPFTKLASQVQHLKKLGIDVGLRPVWSISIDDLRVYADIFDNPLVFLHFVEERMRAFRSTLIRTDDELDHLGLYLKHNIYTQYVQNFDPKISIMWHGYRSNIDRYFSEKLLDPLLKCSLKQDMPARLQEIINFLSVNVKQGCRKVSSMLLNCGGELRGHITSEIDKVLEHQKISGRVKPLSTYGSTNFTLFSWQKGSLERDKILALDHSEAVMLITQDKERLLLELTFDALGKLIDVDFNFLKLEDMSADDIARLKPMAEKIRIKRIDKVKRIHGKIGRNDLCPCGSGKKYKKCCMSESEGR